MALNSHVAREKQYPPGTSNAPHPNERQPSVTNDWMSYGFLRAKNEQELNLQRQAADQYRRFPEKGVPLQLEQIYRALSFLNAVTQFREARTVPGQFRGYTMMLNLFGVPQGGAMDQILPYDSNRRRVTLIASEGSAYISNKLVQNIRPGSYTDFSPLQIEDYFFLPEQVRFPIESTAAIYGVGVSTTTPCVLSILEELYNTPSNLLREYQLARDNDAALIHKSEWGKDTMEDGRSPSTNPLPGKSSPNPSDTPGSVQARSRGQ